MRKNSHFFTYQLKTERAFKVVFCNLHSSLNPKDIKDSLVAEGFRVCSVVNNSHWKMRNPLPLFFVDLEPTDSNKYFYQLQTLVHTRIVVESPIPKR